MANTVEVAICRCRGALTNEPDFDRLLQLLAKNKRVVKVHVIDHLCGEDGLRQLAAQVTGGSDAGLVVAACAAEPLARLLAPRLAAVGIPRQAVEIVPVREWAFWAHPGKRATAAANDVIRMATARVKAAKDAGHWLAGSAYINRLGCDKCKRCTEECPTGACLLGPDGYPLVKAELCQRCGLCVGSCPKQVIALPDLRVEEASAGLRALKGDGSGEPTVVAFCCEPLTYPALAAKAAEGQKLPDNMRIIRVPCMGAVNMALVSDALSAGVDSVLLFGCQDGPCALRRGDELAIRRLENLRETLERMMFDVERVRYIGWPEAASGGVEVDAARCSGCMACREVCPFGAAQPTEKAVCGQARRVSERTPACRACGVCTAACPSGACQLREGSDRQLQDEIDAVCWEGLEPAAGDAVVLCNCMGSLSDRLNLATLAERLWTKGFGWVIEASRLCAPEEWEKIQASLAEGPTPRVVVAGACAGDFFGARLQRYGRDAGLADNHLGVVDLWGRALAGDTAEACVGDVVACAARLARATPAGSEGDGALAACLNAQMEQLKALGPNPFKDQG